MKFWSRVVFKFSCAFKGLGIAFTTDNSFKFHFSAAVTVTGLGFFLHLELWEWTTLIIAMGLVVVSELFNTAIEYLVKLFTQEYHELAEKLLDIAAGAVLFATFVALALGALVFLPRFLRLFGAA